MKQTALTCHALGHNTCESCLNDAKSKTLFILKRHTTDVKLGGDPGDRVPECSCVIAVVVLASKVQ